MDTREQIDIQATLRATRTGLWRLEFENGKMVRLFADDLMDELLGVTEALSPEERLALFYTRLHPEDKALFEDYIGKITEIHTEIIYRYVHPESGEMVVRCGGVRQGRDDSAFCIVGTHQDISNIIRLEQGRLRERRLAEQNLTLRKEQARQEDYYRELLDAQNCGLLAYTMPVHKIIHMNADALRMFGLNSIEDAQSHLGTILSKAYYPDAETIEKLKGIRDVDDAVDYECIINKGQPNECHVMAKTKVIRILTGERAALTTFLDVSDMMMLRRALHQAQEGSRAKSAFLFAMSHDLRTPMNAIIGYANLLEAHWGEQEVCETYLRKLKEAGRFLLALIGNVLEVSRIESGKESLHPAPWDLRKLNDTMDVLLEGEIAQKQLQVTRNIQLEHPWVYCDALKVREILMNLLSNAVKYTSQGGKITMTLSEAPSDRPGFGRYRMAVEDTGIGIAPEYIPHLFEAFSRERSSSESGIMGTGLGLRIVKSFLDLMGGTIAVESSPGKGSWFVADLTLELAPAEALPETEQPRASGTVLKGKRVLLTEDNTLNAEIAETILTDAGLLVETAENGAVALEKLKTAPEGYFDIVLMDIQMPRMNGYQAARAIRALEGERAKTPIIAMTANAFEEDRQAAFESGMDAYASKPIEPQKLLEIIAGTLTQGK